MGEKPESKKSGAARSLPPEGERTATFHFGARRYTSSGPRRLFVSDSSSLDPIISPELARPHDLLRSRPAGIESRL